MSSAQTQAGAAIQTPGAAKPRGAPKPTAPDWQLANSRELHRFRLAALLVSGFLILLVYDMYLGGYFDIATLAGIFSGWIVAIIGFYFMDQASDRTQQQAISITEKADRKVAGIADKGSQSAEELERIGTSAKDMQAAIVEALRQKDAAVKLAEELQMALDEALS